MDFLIAFLIMIGFIASSNEQDLLEINKVDEDYLHVIKYNDKGEVVDETLIALDNLEDMY